MEKLLSAQGLADYVDVPLETVYRWNYVGSGPPAIKVGRHLRFRERDVEAWLDKKAKAAAMAS
jgi:excisionase family DNA binding protein